MLAAQEERITKLEKQYKELKLKKKKIKRIKDIVNGQAYKMAKK